jgi:hypothetical protein
VRQNDVQPETRCDRITRTENVETTRESSHQLECVIIVLGALAIDSGSSRNMRCAIDVPARCFQHTLITLYQRLTRSTRLHNSALCLDDEVDCEVRLHVVVGGVATGISSGVIRRRGPVEGIS